MPLPRITTPKGHSAYRYGIAINISTQPVGKIKKFRLVCSRACPSSPTCRQYRNTPPSTMAGRTAQYNSIFHIGGNSLRISAAHLLTLAHDHGSLHSILGPNNLRQPRSLASRSAGNLRRVSLALSQSHIVSTSFPQWTQTTGRPLATLLMQFRPAPSRPSQDDMSHFPQCGHREYWQACQPATHVMRDKTIHGRLSRLR